MPKKEEVREVYFTSVAKYTSGVMVVKGKCPFCRKECNVTIFKNRADIVSNACDHYTHRDMHYFYFKKVKSPRKRKVNQPGLFDEERNNE